MKYLIIKCIFLIIPFIFFSCKKLIEIGPPKTSLVRETVFHTDEQATAAMLGVYATMRTSGYASGAITSLSSRVGFSSDELLGYNATYLPYFENKLTPENIDLGSLYSEMYRSVFMANLILEGLSESKGLSVSVKNQLEGEALFVRSFTFFYLVNLFGEVPLHLSSDFRITSLAPRAAVAAVYSQLIADLQIAEQKMQESYQGAGRVRPNKSAAQAMLARVYLYAEDWQNAEKYASLVIGKTNTYNLLNFDVVFLVNSREAIWQLEPPINSNALEGGLFIPANLTIPPTTASLRPVFVQEAFESSDKRREFWVKSYTANSITFYYPFKYRVRVAASATEYSMILRLAEQYLIRAEARIQQDKVDIGLADINYVRQRQLPNGSYANTLMPLALTLNKNDAILALERERKAEFFSEWGHRWFDLKRTKRMNVVLSALKPQWKPTAALYPIPQNEIDRNSNISQNPGY